MSDFNSRDYSTLAFRLALGVVFLAHGLAKVLIYTVPGTVAFFESVGFPGVLAYPVIAVELVGGLSLIVGVGSRWAALALTPVALGAVVVHWGNGWVFSNENGGWEFPAMLAVVSVGYFLVGSDGALSLRDLVDARVPWKAAPHSSSKPHRPA